MSIHRNPFRLHIARPARLGAVGALAAALGTACSPPPQPRPAEGPAAAGAPVGVREQDVREALGVLAADSMEGRGTATRGTERAARYIAAELARHGVRPAGDGGTFFQNVPLARTTRADGRSGLRLLTSWAMDSVPVARRAQDRNVVGIIPGSDPRLRDQAILVDAHYDHLGIGRAVDGDSIYNGADDDASGVVAVLEVARALSRGPAPARTVVFLLSTGEERGLLGTRWYVEHPVWPLERTVANLEIEMIARPDPKAGGAGRAWLTGYDRTSMGQMLRAAGIPIVPDPYPAQNFYERSDNIAFARRGIPAHVVSSYNLHADYHTPGDEVSRVDFAHMTAVIEATVRAVRLLADGPLPQWYPGRRPAAPAPR